MSGGGYFVGCGSCEFCRSFYFAPASFMGFVRSLCFGERFEHGLMTPRLLPHRGSRACTGYIY